MRKSTNKKRLVFVVDDQPLYAQILSEDLSEKGVLTHSFTNAEDCIDALHRKPDVILMDFELDPAGEQMNGVAALCKIKQEMPEVPVMMLSGHDDLKIVTTSMRYGAYDYIVKNDSTLLNLSNKLSHVFSRQDTLAELKAVKDLKRGVFAVAAFALLFAFFADKMF